MKKIKTVVFSLIITACALSCANGKGGLDYRRNIVPVKGVLLQIEHLTGKPYDLVCKDDLLIYYDYYDGELLSMYDLKKNRFVGRFVAVGNGPDEAVPPLAVVSWPQKDRLYTYQRNTATLSVFGVPDFRIRNSIRFASSTPWNPLKLAKTRDFYIGETVYDEGRFGVYNSEGKLLQTGGTYPFGGKDLDPMPAFILYQGATCANPENNRFAVGGTFCDHIAFYEAGEDGITLLKEYASSDVRATYPGQLVVDKECVISYTGACGTASYCYMLYSGKTCAANGERSEGGNCIIVFDWEGNYVKTLEADREIRTFCVDEAAQMIYAAALGDDGEYGIIKFKL
ncbi:MAG: TolB-like 6-bladed beta-propeller domain-containing protein [Tannerella sp.]|jgi:hypothetical protein|nr:TolB-like 6-bladed beta-propeller domain-containing protein [Tannerella sp.]